MDFTSLLAPLYTTSGCPLSVALSMPSLTSGIPLATAVVSTPATMVPLESLGMAYLMEKLSRGTMGRGTTA
uniref:Uncharacterized protein n=1 Tax=Arundo donax TaxID=35708 RepID=A0A0A9AGQ6_ARUDO